MKRQSTQDLAEWADSFCDDFGALSFERRQQFIRHARSTHGRLAVLHHQRGSVLLRAESNQGAQPARAELA